MLWSHVGMQKFARVKGYIHLAKDAQSASGENTHWRETQFKIRVVPPVYAHSASSSLYAGDDHVPP